MAFDLSTQHVNLMSRLEGPFCAFLTLASESDFHNATTQYFLFVDAWVFSIHHVQHFLEVECITNTKLIPSSLHYDV